MVRVPLLLLAIVATFYWKVAFTRQYDWGWGPDFASQVLPWFHVQARQWHQGLFPVWDPYLWGGQPLLGQAQPGAAYPLNWLLFLLPLARDGSIRIGWLQWYLVAIHWMAAVFCYWLCRDLGRSRTAAVLAGLVSSFSGYLGTTNWPQMINGAVWAPLVLMFAFRALRGHRPWVSAAWSGVALGFAWLSGHHQIPLFTSYAVAGVWVWGCSRQLSRLRLAAVAMLFAGLTGALQILPAQEYGKLAKRWAGTAEGLRWDQPVPYRVHEDLAMPAGLVSGLLLPAAQKNVDPFAGVVAVTLAVLGVALCWHLPGVPVLACLGVAAWIYSTGGATFLEGLFYAAVPFAEKARTPAAALNLFHMSLAVLAAFGLDAVKDGAAQTWTRRVGGTLFLFGAVLAVALYLVRPAGLEPRHGLAMVVAWMLAPLLAARATVPIMLLLLLELGASTGILIAPRDDPGRMLWTTQMRSHTDVAAFLKRQPRPFRIATLNNQPFENWGAFHGIEARRGYLASISVNRADWAADPNGDRVFNTRYLVAKQPEGHHRHLVFEGQDGMKVYEDPDVFPRAWAVHRTAHIASVADVHAIVDQRHQDFRNTAFFTQGAPTLGGCDSTGEVRVAGYGDDHIVLDAKLPCDGLVVVSSTYLPGWRATVDGREAPVVEANLLMPAVAIPRGEHRIELRYRPRSVYLGALLTALGLLGAGCATQKWRQRTPDTEPRPQGSG